MNNKQKKAMFGMIAIVLLLLLIGIGYLWDIVRKQEENKNTEPNTEVLSQADKNSIYHDGKEYVYNKNVKNILFLGIDKGEEITLNETLGKGGQADTIMLFSIDRENQTTRILQISRNAMTDIDLYDKNGNYYTSIKAQLATQYAYGNGADTSCWATKRTVSELLNDLPIAGYFALDISGVSVINDMIGGVTITIPEDYTEIDPAFVKGATITLNGKQAEKYVRYRDPNMIGGNDLRMQRQAQYIPALLDSLSKISEKTDEELNRMMEAISKYMVTDLSADDLKVMLKSDINMKNIETVPGESKKGEIYEEFYVDEENLQKILIKMFYKQK